MEYKYIKRLVLNYEIICKINNENILQSHSDLPFFLEAIMEAYKNIMFKVAGILQALAVEGLADEAASVHIKTDYF